MAQAYPAISIAATAFGIGSQISHARNQLYPRYTPNGAPDNGIQQNQANIAQALQAYQQAQAPVSNAGADIPRGSVSVPSVAAPSLLDQLNAFASQAGQRG